MTPHVNIGGSENLVLKGALLIYQGGDRSFVTWHEAKRESEEGTPYLGEAHEITTAFVHELAAGLGSQIPVEILPANVLVRTAETLVWWTPRAIRTLFFFNNNGQASLSLNKRYPQPALVWRVSGRDLWVRALRSNRRPSAETQLMIAPYWNVDGENGWTCQGSMRSPDETGIRAIEAWEEAFFRSEFTHQTGALRLTTHPLGFFGLWEAAGEHGLFPAKYLIPAKQTLMEFAQRTR